MEIKILFSRGKSEYIIELDKLFYLINTHEKTMSDKQELTQILYAFKDFEPFREVNELLLNNIKEIVANQRFFSTSKGALTLGKLSEEELYELNFQRDIDYKDFIGEEILVAYESGNDSATLMRLVEIIMPDYDNWDEYCYKFDNAGKALYLNKSEIYQFLPKKWLDDENHEYYYVIFRFGKTERSKEHIYISNDYSIKIGDKVLPFGNEKIGNVVKTGFYKKSNAPYPIEKTWLISRKAYAEIDASRYNDFNKYVDSTNKYYNWLQKQNRYKNYIAKALDTYEMFSWGYIDHVHDYMMPNEDGKYDGKNILNFLTYEFEECCYYDNDYQGEFLMRYNQLYTFFDSVWMSYLLAKNDYVREGTIEVYKYMLCIYNNGGFDKYLLDVEYDKKCLNEHITFINDYIGFKI